MTSEQTVRSRTWALTLLALPFAALILFAQRLGTFEPLNFEGPPLVALVVFAVAVLVNALWCWAVPRGPLQWAVATIVSLAPWGVGAIADLLRTWSTAEALAHVDWASKISILINGLALALSHRAFGAELTAALLAALAIAIAHSAASTGGALVLLRPTRGMILTIGLAAFVAVYPQERAPFASVLLGCAALLWVQAVARIDGDREGLDARLVSLVVAAGALLTGAISARVELASRIHEALERPLYDLNLLLDLHAPGATLARYLWFAGLLAVAFLAVALLIPTLPQAPGARQRLKWPVLLSGVLFIATAADSALQQYAFKAPKNFARLLATHAEEYTLPEAPFQTAFLPLTPIWTGVGELPADAVVEKRVTVAMAGEAGVEKLEAVLAAAKDAGATELRFAARPHEPRVPKAPEYSAVQLLMKAPVGFDVLVDPEALRRSTPDAVPELSLGDAAPDWDVHAVILRLDEASTVAELVEQLATHAARQQQVALAPREVEPAVAAPGEP